MNPDERKSILLLEDDVGWRESLAFALMIDAAIEVRQAETLDEAREACEERLPDLIVVDIMLPSDHDREGLDFCETIRTRYGATPKLVLLTNRDDAEVEAEATCAPISADAFIRKEADLDHILDVLEGMLWPGPRTAEVSS